MGGPNYCQDIAGGTSGRFGGSSPRRPRIEAAKSNGVGGRGVGGGDGGGRILLWGTTGPPRSRSRWANAYGPCAELENCHWTMSSEHPGGGGAPRPWEPTSEGSAI